METTNEIELPKSEITESEILGSEELPEETVMMPEIIHTESEIFTGDINIIEHNIIEQSQKRMQQRRNGFIVPNTSQRQMVISREEGEQVLGDIGDRIERQHARAIKQSGCGSFYLLKMFKQYF